MECQSLEEVRQHIDQIDDEIIKKIAERKFYVSQASKFKKNEQGVKAPGRVEQVIQKVRTKAETYGAPPDLVESLYRDMISKFIQMEMEEFKQQQQQQ
ncbi:chorismate mutase [Anaeromyces robustus]|uniref:Chorismate mutase n=1 Tax=Anaeromyces robustus TaxID=1754192 RepID=A0A1Y1XSC7_9FUNG|nr:chorismate mutase [Anaeromyces robustus]|eukprot:ORX88214.1 chorismate mutase [Anaeromyces robustus]